MRDVQHVTRNCGSTYLSLMDRITPAGAFGFYAGLCLLGSSCSASQRQRDSASKKYSLSSAMDSAPTAAAQPRNLTMPDETPHEGAYLNSVSAWSSFSESRTSHLTWPFATNSLATLDDARAKPDQEIKAASATASALRSRRNLLLPIAQLHPEVLTHIFFLLATDDDEIPRERAKRYVDQLQLERSIYRVLGWMRVTHVCRKWRNLALDNPALWGINVCSLWEATEERLRRAKHPPLDIHWRSDIADACFEGKDAYLQALVGALDHTRTLDLQSLNADDIKPLIPLLRRAAPLLESFACTSDLESIETGIHHGALALPEDLFGGDAPRLRRLALAEVHIPLHAPLYAGIVDLSLLSIGVPGLSSHFTRGQLLELLERMPKLELLGIRRMILQEVGGGALPSMLDVPSIEPGRRISLPHLRRLKVVDDLEPCLWFLRSTSIPPSAALLIQRRAKIMHGHDIAYHTSTATFSGLLGWTLLNIISHTT
ncbi:hypothetical protein EVG20_g9478 [Dentipellis fragilis]|uniref:Uncharacterized protein n=1 Tax=Dentipellis fragilis TaxID=205917 RepID=A0A4Y9XY11_9AGAM|nr:hypothetical protein EVG20_g9478 [Dentipellis fragilis]